MPVRMGLPSYSFHCCFVSSEEELEDTSMYSADERNKLFARGLSREKEGKREAALKCYMACLTGLTQDTRFVLLPQCLRNVSKAL